jgi:hypothetical protein
MFVSWKKLCKIAQEEAEMWKKIAADKTEHVEALLDQIKDLYDKRANMYNYCCELKRKNEELEAKLDFVIKQRDYYYDLLESTSEVEEKDE